MVSGILEETLKATKEQMKQDRIRNGLVFLITDGCFNVSEVLSFSKECRKSNITTLLIQVGYFYRDVEGLKSLFDHHYMFREFNELKGFMTRFVKKYQAKVAEDIKRGG